MAKKLPKKAAKATLMTSTLGDLVPNKSARQVGSWLFESGLRHFDSTSKAYHVSPAALEEGIAELRTKRGYPVVMWNRERVTDLMLNGVDDATLRRWQGLNEDREQYEADLDRLEQIIDKDAYLSYDEHMNILGIYKGGVGNVGSIYRRAARRALADQREGKALKLRPEHKSAA